MYKYKKYILNKEQSIIFEISELVVLFLIVIYYLYIDKKILALFFAIPFIEHVRQITIYYRQEGGSFIDYITLCYFLFGLCYSISVSNNLGAIACIIGIVIHVITIITKTSFSQLISYDEIKKYLFT